MAERYPSTVFRSIRKRRTNPLRYDESESGVPLTQDLTAYPLFEWEIRHPLILQSDVDTLLEFHYDNEGEYVDTQILADGWTYYGKHIYEPQVQNVNAIRKNVTQRFIGMRAMYGATQPTFLFDEKGIQGSSPVTAWNNDTVVAAGGSDYDLDVKAGGGTLGVTTQNGHTVVDFDGSVYLETTSGQTLSQPNTVFLVAAVDSLAADQHIYDSRSNSGARHTALFNNPGDDIEIYAGTTLNGNVLADTNFHVIMNQYNGASSITFLSGVGTVTGNAGSQSWDFGTLGARYDGTSVAHDGKVAAFAGYNAALDGWIRATIETYLKFKYGTS